MLWARVGSAPLGRAVGRGCCGAGGSAGFVPRPGHRKRGWGAASSVRPVGRARGSPGPVPRSVSPVGASNCRGSPSAETPPRSRGTARSPGLQAAGEAGAGGVRVRELEGWRRPLSGPGPKPRHESTGRPASAKTYPRERRAPLRAPVGVGSSMEPSPAPRLPGYSGLSQVGGGFDALFRGWRRFR